MSDPTADDRQILHDAAHLIDTVVASAWPTQYGHDLLGVEVEAFPLIVDEHGPAGRLWLHGDDGVLDIIRDVSVWSDTIGADSLSDSAFRTAAGGRITFEPGAQIEHSSAPSRSTAGVRTEMEAVWGELRESFWSRRVCLLSLGTDPWSLPDSVPQQLTADRYLAMDRYLGSRSPAGATMMRNTCSVQVNLDAGNGTTRDERWLAANLLSPLLSAMFASSPGPSARSLRAQAWQQLDPSRTGFPAWHTIDDADPVADTVNRALGADVMYFSREGVTWPGRPGFTFGDWLREGHVVAGSPTVRDLETHLTTLFTEVRPRGGVLEFRAIDGLPQAWWHVPLLTVASLLYDASSRQRVIELLEPSASRLDATWRQSASLGLTDLQIGPLASEIAQIALDAAERDPQRFDARDVAAARSYFTDFTWRRLSPADILFPMLGDPAAALAWAAPEHMVRGTT